MFSWVFDRILLGDECFERGSSQILYMAAKKLLLRQKSFKKEGRVGGFFFRNFFLPIFYIKFQKIKIGRDMAFVWCITGQQKIMEWNLKSENTVFIAIPSLNGTVFTD